MKRSITAAARAALSIFIISGCTATVGGSSSLQRDVDQLKAEVATLRDQSRLGDLRGGADSEATRLRAEVQRQLEQLSARLDRLEKRAGLAGPAAPAPGSTPAAAAPYVPPAPETAEPGAAIGGPYEEGKALFDRKDYGEAIDRFQKYLSGEPKGANAAAAQFYIGESLYALKRHEEAILEYQKVVQRFPKSNQVPTSLLKQGLSFQALGEADSAKLLYQKIVNSYPRSYAAGVARE
ncbi:MAG: tol-pal system protein YbgF, partial [Candidatus Adiutrix sp.]|nr:tol-pal system protein YbgF [Candidatus Adiutrix sp.]